MIRDSERLLQFARELQHATTLQELLACARAEVERGLGYAHAWLFVADDPSVETLRLLDVSGSVASAIWENAPILTVRGDAMIEEMVRTDAPVVVLDARTDPRTNKAIVEKLGNRTIINVPIRILDKPYGAFGVGTFHDEGVRPPTREQLDYLVGMVAQLSVAAKRIRTLDEAKARAEELYRIEARLAEVQKLESIGLLAAGVAHDFNNLLTVVLASAGLLKETAKDPTETLQTGAEEIDAIIAAAQRGRALAHQLLAMGRTQPLRRKPLAINEQVAGVVELLRRVLPANVVLDVIAGRVLPMIEADASQLDQVLMNLCLNARDAMPEGGRLTLETEQVVINDAYAKEHPWASEGRFVLTTVTDSGVGMTEAIRKRVFEPFFTTKGDAGSGLGLAVSYGIVRQHDGMLHCYSEPGVGTTFKLYLPVLAREAAQVGTKLARPARGGAERILVAEDDRAVQNALRRVLVRAGYDVTIVGDGEAAREMALSKPFDLVVLDVVMPRLGGTLALDAIRAALPSMRFILSSGYAGDSAATALLEAGAARLLAKPYGPDELLQMVRAALDDAP